MVQDGSGRILLLTNEIRNNVIIYDKAGRVLDTWGKEYPGAHGLTLSKENGEEFLFLTDTVRHEVIKTTLSGKVVLTLGFPKESGLYSKKEEFVPTEVALGPNGEIYVADGYGAQYIVQYSSKGELVRCFGGRNQGPGGFDNAHGIALDQRDPSQTVLLITARQQNALKRFSLDGEYLSTIELPGAFICRPVVAGEHVYLAVLISRMPWNSQSGFVLVLDRDNRVISSLGGSDPTYDEQGLQPLHQVTRLFKHPHDVCVDDEENLYVAQWNSGNIPPLKLVRIS